MPQHGPLIFCFTLQRCLGLNSNNCPGQRGAFNLKYSGMRTGPYGAPTVAGREELQVRTVQRGHHQRPNRQLVTLQPSGRLQKFTNEISPSLSAMFAQNAECCKIISNIPCGSEYERETWGGVAYKHWILAHSLIINSTSFNNRSTSRIPIQITALPITGTTYLIWWIRSRL